MSGAGGATAQQSMDSLDGGGGGDLPLTGPSSGGGNSNQQKQKSTQQHTSSARFELLTEAVPLSLSSMAHASLALDDGVSDGIEQVLQHTLLSCVNYARILHPPHQWTFRDLGTSRYAWEPVKGNASSSDGNNNSTGKCPDDVPYALQKLNFKHQYSRNALIYLKPALPADLTLERELDILKKDWTSCVGILGRISLLYISTEPLTRGELDGTEVDDMPPCMLYKVLVEYRSLPPTGNQQAVQAEELSMLSFGGSVDDNVKFGALASLYDNDAKYVLEIYSVRGKKYKFDLMDSTLSNGTIPRLPASREGDPFVKSLCVTVSDHNVNDLPPQQQQQGTDAKDPKAEKKYAITRIHLLMEGKPRRGNDFDNLPTFDYVANGIKASFLHLNPVPPQMVTALPSGHTLLLDPELAGRIYVNGWYVTTWGLDSRIGSHGIALFGMDLHSIPVWHTSIVNYEELKVAYAQLWHELLVDARLVELNIASKLLRRLMRGQDDDDDDEYDDDYADIEETSPSVSADCLESQVLASSQYDRVGIAPKALATRFGVDYGKDAFPCLSHEIEWVKAVLPDRKPVVVPQRVINVLRRGGYFDVQRTSDDLWFTVTRPPKPDGDERAMVDAAIAMLETAGCEDLAPEQIAFTSMPPVSAAAGVGGGDDAVVKSKVVCRYSEGFQLYCIHEKFLEVAVMQYLEENAAADSTIDVAKVRAYLLGMYIAKEHPDGTLLPRYILRTRPF